MEGHGCVVSFEQIVNPIIGLIQTASSPAAAPAFKIVMRIGCKSTEHAPHNFDGRWYRNGRPDPSFSDDQRAIDDAEPDYAQCRRPFRKFFCHIFHRTAKWRKSWANMAGMAVGIELFWSSVRDVARIFGQPDAGL